MTTDTKKGQTKLNNEMGDDVQRIAVHLFEQADSEHKSDWPGAESLLKSQITTLDRLFNALVNKGNEQKGTPDMETLLNLAFTAQDQARTSMETLFYMTKPESVGLTEQMHRPNKTRPIFSSTKPAPKILTKVHG